MPEGVNSIAWKRSSSRSCEERGMRPSLVPAFIIYPRSVGESPVKRRSRSCAGRFLDTLGDYMFTAAKNSPVEDAPVQESLATSRAFHPVLLQPNTQLSQNARMQNEQRYAAGHGAQKRSLTQRGRHRIVPDDARTDTWKTDLSRKIQEEQRKRGQRVLTVKRLQQIQSDCIIEHALKNRQPAAAAAAAARY